MSPVRHRLPLARLFLAFLVFLTGCLGSDFEDLSLEVQKWDHDWVIAVEPGEAFSVDLFGNNAYPDHRWRVADYDRALLRLDGEEYQTPRPPMLDVEAAEPGVYDEGILDSRSLFFFAGLGVGETPLRFEFVADGVTIDVAEYTVEVIEDACSARTVAVANRCGGDGFASHPQVLHERNFGEQVEIDAGSGVHLVLTANALHPDQPWQVTAYDDSVISVDGPVALPPARTAGDFVTELDADVSHSFLPAWQFTVTGVAPGESELRVEIVGGGTLLDVFEMAVLVTD